MKEILSGFDINWDTKFANDNEKKKWVKRVVDKAHQAGKEEKLSSTYKSSKMYLMGFKDGKAEALKDAEVAYLRGCVLTFKKTGYESHFFDTDKVLVIREKKEGKDKLDKAIDKMFKK